MTTDPTTLVRTPDQITQTTAVEQARAVAEVAAAVRVAQDNPRDMGRALAQMRDTCTRLALAARAFYAVPNRGNGPSVHLARELARIWGNIDYGVRELRRDDDAAESEIQAFAWDQETNTRSSRTFVVPHARMRNKQRVTLDDLGDIYLNNQNIGARAVRECLFSVMPDWFTDEAMTICRTTIDKGDGQPLPDRIRDMLTAFEEIGVTSAQIATKVGRPQSKWTGADVATLGIRYQSIQRGEVDRDEEFPPAQVTAAEITAERPAPRTQPTTPTELPETVTEPPADDDGWPEVTRPGGRS